MNIAESSVRTLRFSAFEVDLRSAELRKHGVRIKLQDQPFRVLSLLLEHPGDIVTREELRQQLWHDHTFVDFDRGLNKAIAKLRSALGDSAESPRYIETIPRHGYRLLVPVASARTWESTLSLASDSLNSAGTAAATAVNGASDIVLPRPSRIFSRLTESHRRFLAAGILVVLLASIGLATYRWRQPTVIDAAPSVKKPRRSVAVLGFHNLSGNPRDAWLSAAFADWLTTELSAGDQLRTVPAENVARMKLELSISDVYNLAPDTLARIRKNLGTDSLVIGSYAVMDQQSGKEIRLDLRLLDANSGETATAFSETEADSHLFQLAANAGGRLRAKLGVREVTSEEAAQVAVVLPSNPEAARLYSEGRERLRVFDALSGRDLLTKAVAKEPDFSLSHAELATAWNQLGYDTNSSLEAKKAFDLSSNLPRAERLLVEGRYRENSHEWEKAVEIYRALFEFFPDNLDYGIALASVEVSAGRGKDALATLAQLRKLPAPESDDPRIDLEEDHAVESLGDFKSLLAISGAAAEKARASGASLLQARALTDHGWALWNLGAPEQVGPVARDAERLYTAAHDQRGVAIAATEGGIALQTQGDLEGARQQYERSLAIYRTIGYQFGVANELDNFGDIYLALGNLPQARKSYEESFRTYHEIGHVDGEALTKAGLGEVFLRLGETMKSKHLLEESLQICRQIGDRSKEGSALSGLGRLSRLQGDADTAWQLESQAKSIFDEIGDQSQSAQMRTFISDLLMDRARYQEAAEMLRQSAQFFEKTKANKNAAEAYQSMGRALFAEGKLQEARSYIDRSQKIARLSHDEELELAGEIAAAQIAAASAGIFDTSEIAKKLRDVAARAQQQKFAGLTLEARLALGEIEARSGPRGDGRLELANVQQEATKRGFGQIARTAGAALRQ